MRKNILHILVICAIMVSAFSSLIAQPVSAQTSSNPDMVNIPGTHQDESGCPAEWNPSCENTKLVLDFFFGTRTTRITLIFTERTFKKSAFSVCSVREASVYKRSMIRI